MITGYAPEAFTSFGHALFSNNEIIGEHNKNRENVPELPENFIWKVVIPSYINGKPVTKLSKNFIDQNINDLIIDESDLESVNGYAWGSQYSSNYDYYERRYDFFYAIGLQYDSDSGTWTYDGALKYYPNSFGDDASDSRKGEIFLRVSYANSYAEWQGRKQDVGGNGKVTFTMRVSPTQVIIPSTVTEIYDNSTATSKVENAKSEKLMKIANIYKPQKLEIEVDLPDFPDLPPLNPDTYNAIGFDLNISSLQRSTNTQFRFVDKADLSNVKNSSILTNAIANGDGSISYSSY